MIVINTGFRASKSFWLKMWLQILIVFAGYIYMCVCVRVCVCVCVCVCEITWGGYVALPPS